jgi:hypothetical protein
MERFIHLANLALFRKRLTEPCDDARRQLLLKLLAEEEAKELLRNGDKAAVAKAADELRLRTNWSI